MLVSPASARTWIATRVDESARARALAAFDATAARLTSDPASGVVLFSEDNVEYAGAFLAAFSHGKSIWCGNPKWAAGSRAEAAAAIPVGVVAFGATAPFVASSNDAVSAGGVYIPTGGTGGRIRFIRHSVATLSAAVSGFSEYAGRRLLGGATPARLHAVQALPCCHVSGLMPVVRAYLTDAELVFTSPSFRDDVPLPAMPQGDGGLCIVSLVNAQLHRLLERADGPEWMRTAGLILVGGSAVTPELLARASALRIPVGVSYGLTEAPALAALYPPEALWRGETPVAGEVLPHVCAEITDTGRVRLSGASLGEDVPRDATGGFVTGDEGYLDAKGRLVVTGRADRIIVTGGEKVDPVRVESALREARVFDDVMVVDEPDAEWGRRLVVLYTSAAPSSVGERHAADFIRARLGPVFTPRRWIHVSELPLDARGKRDHERVGALLSAR